MALQVELNNIYYHDHYKEMILPSSVYNLFDQFPYCKEVSFSRKLTLIGLAFLGVLFYGKKFKEKFNATRSSNPLLFYSIDHAIDFLKNLNNPNEEEKYYTFLLDLYENYSVIYRDERGFMLMHFLEPEIKKFLSTWFKECCTYRNGGYAFTFLEPEQYQNLIKKHGLEELINFDKDYINYDLQQELQAKLKGKVNE